MPGARQKAPGLLANQRGGRGRGLTVIVPEERKVPRMPVAPAGLAWGKGARAVWRSFWRSPVSMAVDVNADAERLGRWMEAIEERERLLAEVREQGYAPARTIVRDEETEDGRVLVLMAGAHPNLAYIKHLDREIAKLSDHFGLTPLSRFRLQLTFAEKEQAGRRLRRDQSRDTKPAEGAIDLDALG